ncbi:MAG: hypothetical protein E7586_05175 [Ruminococcaceae bacterium]|nr:hypothetical protein [Oscillospiraceae bacterium]
MNKRLISLFALVLSVCLLLCGCTKWNVYNLSFVPDNSDSTYYTYFDEEKVVYTVGGIMMTEIEGESMTLESALIEGKTTVAEILASAAEDAENEKIQTQTYIDGSVEYTYNDFRLVLLNSATDRNIYFIPLEMNYYSLVN